MYRTKRQVYESLGRWHYEAVGSAIFTITSHPSSMIFTGFALFLGVREAHMGILMALPAAASVLQPLMSLWVQRIQNKKRFLLLGKFTEISIRWLILLVPLLVPAEQRIHVLAVMILAAYLVINSASPIFQSWFATSIPDDIRGKYFGKRNFIFHVAIIVFLYLAGLLLDQWREYASFFAILTVGCALGATGFAIIGRNPFPEMPRTESPNLRELVKPFSNPGFRALVYFQASWMFAHSVAAPFYQVFMLNHLQLSYSKIAIFTNLQIGALIVGFLIWGRFVNRYGSKPVLQVCLAFALFIPFLWIINAPAFHYMVPVAMLLVGFFHSGVGMAIGNLIYGPLMPPGEKPTYFAAWASVNGTVGFIGPLVGGFLVNHLQGFHLQIGALPVGNIQVVFFASAMLLIPSVIMGGIVHDARSTRPAIMLRQVTSGNPFGYLYNYLVFVRSRHEGKRAKAVKGLGAARSQMATDTLIQALGDYQPEVRREAALALGEIGDARALEPLSHHVRNADSDVRLEAASSLGKLRNPDGVGILVEALDSPEYQVKRHAALALSELGGDQAREALHARLQSGFDPLISPTLVISLARLGDDRIVAPSLCYMDALPDQVLRIQIMNAICSVLRTRNSFFKIISEEEINKAQSVSKILRFGERKLRGIRFSEAKTAEGIISAFKLVHDAFDNDDYEACKREAWAFGQSLEATLETGPTLLPPDNVGRIGLFHQTTMTFLLQRKDREISPEGIIFMLLLLTGWIDELFLKRREVFPGRGRGGKRSARNRTLQAVSSPARGPGES